MIPVVCYSLPQEAWRIYLRPSLAQAIENMKQTHGSRYDRVERETVVGGVSTVWNVFPTYFSTKEQALASIKA